MFLSEIKTFFRRRWFEIALFTAFGVWSALWLQTGLGLHPGQNLPAMAALTIGYLFFYVHAFALNDLVGLWLDSNLDARPGRGVRFCVALGLVGTWAAWWVFFPEALFSVGALVLVSWLYSGPVLKMEWGGKNIPVLSSMLHIAAGILPFVIANRVFGGPSFWSVPIGLTSVYFGILLAAGHLVHEAGDVGDDQRQGQATHAVRYGMHWALRMSLALFMVAPLPLLLGSYGLGLVQTPGADQTSGAGQAFTAGSMPTALKMEKTLLLGALSLSLAHVVLFCICRTQIERYRFFYRLLYGGFGFFMAIYVFFMTGWF